MGRQVNTAMATTCRVSAALVVSLLCGQSVAAGPAGEQRPPDAATLSALVERATTPPAALAPAEAVALLAHGPPRLWRSWFFAGATRLLTRAKGSADPGDALRLARATERWAFDSLLAAKPPDEAIVEVTFLQLYWPAPPKREDAERAYAQVVRVAQGTELHAAAAMLLAEAAQRDDPELSAAKVEEAVAILERRAPNTVAPDAIVRVKRVQVAVLARAGRYREAIAAERALPLALGGFRRQEPFACEIGLHFEYLPRAAAASDLDAAVDELTQVALWSDASTPEWVRALGVLMVPLERSGHPQAASVRAEFEAGIERILDADRKRTRDFDVDVVIHQLVERGAIDSAEEAGRRARLRKIPGH